jgi:hypothetical protein
MLITVRAAIALGLGALTLLLVLLQFGARVSARREGQGYSFVPFIGAILGVSACLLAPWEGSGCLLPIAFALDPTPSFVCLPVDSERRPTRRCSRTNASLASLGRALAAERQYR